MEKPIRQGDILLTPVSDREERGRIRRNGKTVRRVRGKGLIVAAGEATGHHHHVRTLGARLVEHDGKLYLIAPQDGAELEHEEHETLTIPHGTHKVSHQREYVPPVRPQQAPRTTRVYD